MFDLVKGCLFGLVIAWVGDWMGWVIALMGDRVKG
jgi:hypothetical protein